MKSTSIAVTLALSLSLASSCAEKPAEACGPQSCSGCCDQGTCVAAPAEAACGVAGAACVACPTGATCTLGACVLTASDAGAGDAGGADAGQADAGQADAGEPDAGQPDAGERDAGTDGGFCISAVACGTNPAAPCRLGVTECSTGAARCVDGASTDGGTSCGVDQVCDGLGACVGCVTGQACGTNPNATCAQGITQCATGVAQCVDGAPLAAGTSCGAGQVCNGAGTCNACSEGQSCGTNPSACAQGVTSCASGSQTCLDAAPRAPGTGCGTNQVCNSSGQCVACVAGAACSGNPAVCRAGATSCSTGASTCADGAPRTAGTACGVSQVCDGSGFCGACVAGQACTGNSDACRAGVTSCTTGSTTCTNGALRAAGTACGLNLVCSAAGACTACTAAQACSTNPGSACRLGAIACTTGAPVCTDGAPKAAGTSCGASQVCNGAGACGACTSGQACSTNPDACRNGVTSCTTGSQQCVDGTAKSAGASCGTDLVCTAAGACVACVTGQACTSNPDAACRNGVIACTTGAPVCANGAVKAPGTTCGAGQVCDALGACVACSAGAGCSGNPTVCKVGVVACSAGPQCADGAARPVGDTCGVAQVCNAASQCVSCAAGTACSGNPNAACFTGVVGCGTGGPVCGNDTQQPAGTACGVAQVCDATGACVGCANGGACSTNPGLCFNGRTTCATGPMCVDGTAKAAGSSCGTNLVCDGAQQCNACTVGAACTGNPNVCALGTTSCTTGTPVCNNGAALPVGAPCGGGQVCSGVACVACAPATLATGPCSADGWCWSWPAPAGGGDFTAGWAASTGEVFLGTRKGTVARRSGGAWTIDNGTPVEAPVRWLHGSSATDVWAVGLDFAMRWNGATWTSATLPQAGLQLNGVWVASPNDAWAVGSTTGTGGAVLHWNGVTWSVDHLTAAPCFGVWGQSPTDLYTACGAGLAERRNTGVWSTVAVFSPGGATWTQPLYSIWGHTSGTAYLVMGGYDGHDWRWQADWSLANTWLDGLRRYDMFVRNGVLPTATSGSRFSHFIAGTTADEVRTTAMGSGGQEWNAFAFVGEAERLIAGEVGRVGRWNIASQTWTFLPGRVALEMARNTQLVAPADCGLFAGVSRRLGPLSSTTPEFAGSLGGPSLALLAGPTTNITALWAASAFDLWVADGAGTLYRRLDGAWQAGVAPPATGAPTALHGSSATNVILVTATGQTARYDGSTWSASASGAANLADVYVASPSLAFAVGAGGALRQWNGAAWSAVTSGTAANLAGIAGSSASDVWAVGAAGTVLHYNGSSWAPVALATTESLVDVAVKNATSAVIISSIGNAWVWNGATWTRQRTPATYASSVTVNANGYFVAGGGGLLTHP